MILIWKPERHPSLDTESTRTLEDSRQKENYSYCLHIHVHFLYFLKFVANVVGIFLQDDTLLFIVKFN